MEIVRVRLRKPMRVLTFACTGLSLSRGEHVIVRTESGLEFGETIIDPEAVMDEMSQQFSMSVVRRINSSDEASFRQIVEAEVNAFDVCQRRISQRNLAMKLADVEYSYDRRRVVFYFTAEDRVDFRELVRDLAHDLKARIELRHIQVRDQAKMVGGFAACGRELCCKSWMPCFYPISMKMAKRQNLSLNPTKISGQCGRLMCCLAFENDMYEDPKRKKKVEQGGCESCPCPGASSEPVSVPVPVEEMQTIPEPDFCEDIEPDAPGVVVVAADLDEGGIEIVEFVDEGDETEGVGGDGEETVAPDGERIRSRKARRRRKKRKGGPPQGAGAPQ